MKGKVLLIAILCLLLAACSKEMNEGKPGTQSNPVSIGKSIIVTTNRFDEEMVAYKTKTAFEVLEVIRGKDAAKIVKSNPSNKPAPKGYEYIITKMRVKSVEQTREAGMLIVSPLNFKYVSNKDYIYKCDKAPIIKNELNYEGYFGNKKDGFIIGLVKSGEKVKLQYENFFFNLK